MEVKKHQIDRIYEGQITDFFSYTFLEIAKRSDTKKAKSQINPMQKDKNHKLLRNY